MSLFSGLFSGGAAAPSTGLFSESSAFKHEDNVKAVNRTAASLKETDGSKGKKRKGEEPTKAVERPVPSQNGSQAKKQKQGQPTQQVGKQGSQHVAAHGARMAAPAKAHTANGETDTAATKVPKQQKSAKEDKRNKKAQPSKKAAKQQAAESDDEDADDEDLSLEADSEHADGEDSGAHSDEDADDGDEDEEGPSDAGGEAAGSEGEEASGSGEGEEEEGKADALVHEAAKPKKSEEEQAAELARTVFVGNVPAKSTRKDLTKLFSKYGKVASVRLRAVPLDVESKLPRRAAILTGKVDDARAPAVAYVVFQAEEGATAALAANMTEFGGHHLRVNRATMPSKKKVAGAEGSTPGAAGSAEFDPTRSLFIGNLHFQTTDEELITFFTGPEALVGNPELAPSDAGVPALEAVRVVRDPGTSIGKGFAFALFRTKAAARAGLSLNGKELRKRELRITRVSVQQQQKVRMAAAVASAPKKPHAGPGSKGGPGGSKGPRGAVSPALPEAAWQGTKTKGKGGGVRGGKALARAGGSSGAPAATPNNRKRDSKRPAVAARKARKAAQANPGGVQAGGVGKPFRGGPPKGGKGPRGAPGKGGFKGGKPGGKGGRQ